MTRINAIVLTGMLLMAAYSEARVVEKFTQNKLLERSDVVVIGRLESCHDAEKTEEGYARVYVARRATFVVQSVLKGEKVQDRVTLLLYRYRTLQDDLDDGKTERELLVIINGYHLAKIPDYPPENAQANSVKSESTAVRDSIRKRLKTPIKEEQTKIDDDSRLYLLYLKRADSDEYLPVSGKDSRYSVFEIHSTK